MELNPAELKASELNRIILGTVVPRPIAWVSTINAQGQPNLAPFSFFNAVCTRPPTLLFCPGIRSLDGGVKDTLNNIRATGEYVINVVTEATAEAMNRTATELPAEVNEFEFGGVTPAASVVVRPARVAESPVNFECQLRQIVEIGDGKPGSGWIVIGEVVHLHVEQRVAGRLAPGARELARLAQGVRRRRESLRRHARKRPLAGLNGVLLALQQVDLERP